MKKQTFRAGLLMAAVAVAACDESTSAPDANLDAIEDDVALIAADAAVEDLDVMNTMVPIGAASAPVAFNILDRARSRVVEFYDAEGNEQESYDALTTASIFTSLEVAGSMERADFEWSMNRSREMTVTGLEGEETERTFNGTGEEDRSRARVLENDAERTYTFSGTLLVEDVVRGVPRSENPWPLSGTITRNVDIEIVNGPRGDETISRVVTLTFNGTQFVTLTVNDVEYEIDLANRDRDGVRRRRGGGSSS